jgi:hypothetical protein
VSYEVHDQMAIPAVEIERPRPNYPLMIVGGFVFLCLIGAVVLAYGSSVWSVLVLCVFAIFGAAAFAYFNSLKPQLGLQHRLEWRPAPTDLQQQSLALEVEGIAASLELDPWQTTDLFTAYVVAEDLALRRMQQDHTAPMIRHLQIGGAAFDALIIEQNELICVEVSFVVKPDMRQEKVDAILRKMGTVKRFLVSQRLDVAVRLMIVVVTQLTPEEVDELKSRLTGKRFPDSPVNIDIHFFDFEELQRTYMTES